MQNGFSWTRAATTVALAGCILLASRATLAQTTELNPGDSVTPPPTLGAPLGGTLVDSLISPFDRTFNGQTITGNVISAVYTNGDPEDGVFGGAGYDFYYQIEFTGGNAAITGVNPASFLGFRTSVGQASDGDGAGGVLVAGGDSSAQARRTLDGEGMNFDFVGFAPGETSFSLIIRTDATSASRSGSIGILGSGVTATVLTLAPVPFGVVAPEPGALSLLALGGVTFIALRRRR